MIISMYVEEAFDKIQQPFWVKALIRVGRDRKFFNLIKGIYKLSRAKIILTGKELHVFPKLKNKIRMFTVATSI